TGLKSGTLYPILIRLAERKLLETSWETAEVGKPPRHLYRLTPEGMRFAQEHHLRHATGRLARVAFSGANREMSAPADWRRGCCMKWCGTRHPTAGTGRMQCCANWIS